MPEIKLPPSRFINMSIPSEHEELMQQHLRDENLPEAVMPAMLINRVLKGQKALVTGANSGIGKAVALSLANAGADVVVNYVSRPEAAEEVVTRIASHGGNAFALKARRHPATRRCHCLNLESISPSSSSTCHARATRKRWIAFWLTTSS